MFLWFCQSFSALRHLGDQDKGAAGEQRIRRPGFFHLRFAIDQAFKRLGQRREAPTPAPAPLTCGACLKKNRRAQGRNRCLQRVAVFVGGPGEEEAAEIALRDAQNADGGVAFVEKFLQRLRGARAVAIRCGARRIVELPPARIADRRDGIVEGKRARRFAVGIEIEREFLQSAAGQRPVAQQRRREICDRVGVGGDPLPVQRVADKSGEALLVIDIAGDGGKPRGAFEQLAQGRARTEVARFDEDEAVAVRLVRS